MYILERLEYTAGHDIFTESIAVSTDVHKLKNHIRHKNKKIKWEKIDEVYSTKVGDIRYVIRSIRCLS